MASSPASTSQGSAAHHWLHRDIGDCCGVMRVHVTPLSVWALGGGGGVEDLALGGADVGVVTIGEGLSAF